jgi:hypothetical protein
MLTPVGPTEYNVYVKVIHPTGLPDVYYVILDPERVLLDGKADGNTIIWTMKASTPEEPSLATFQATTDIEFETAEGQARFTDFTFNSAIENGQITAKVAGPEINETIFTYYINAHLTGTSFVIRVDPEVDNPPPPRP